MGEMQIKTKMIYYFLPIWMATTKRTRKLHDRRNVDKVESLSTVGRNIPGVASIKQQNKPTKKPRIVIPQKIRNSTTIQSNNFISVYISNRTENWILKR
jgi:hypothetical protein